MSDGRRLAIVSDYDGLIKALRARADELAVTRETLDAVTGLQSGYAAKLLAPVPIRQLGRVSLGPMLQALGLAIVIVEDLTALQRISGQLEKRTRPVAHAGEAMPAKKRQRKRLKGNSGWGQLMRARQILIQDESKRARIARKAARVRWRGKRKPKRASAMPLSDTLAAPCAS